MFNFTGLSAGPNSARRDLHLRPGGELLAKREPGEAARPRDTSYLGELPTRPPPPHLSPRVPLAPRGSMAASPRAVADPDASPRALPTSRADVRALAGRLDAELAAAHQLRRGGSSMATAARTARERAWRVAHAELIAQVRVQCAERGALLARAHAALVEASDEREALIQTLVSKHGEAAVVRQLRAELDEARAALLKATSALPARHVSVAGLAERDEPARQPLPHPSSVQTLGAQLDFLTAAKRAEPAGHAAARAYAEAGDGRPAAPALAAASPTASGHRRNHARPGGKPPAAAAAEPPLPPLVALALAVAQGQKGRAELSATIFAGLARLGSSAACFEMLVELAVLAAANDDASTAPTPTPTTTPTTTTTTTTLTASSGAGVDPRADETTSPRPARPAAPAPPEPVADAGASALKAVRLHGGDAAAARARAVGTLVEVALRPVEREAAFAFLAARAAPLERRALFESAFVAVGAERPTRELTECLEPLFWLAGEHRWSAALCALYEMLPARAKLAALRQLGPALGADGREELKLSALPPPPPSRDAAAQTDATAADDLADSPGSGADGHGGGSPGGRIYSPRGTHVAHKARTSSAVFVIDPSCGSLSPRAGRTSGAADGGLGGLSLRGRLMVRQPSALAVVDGGSSSPRRVAPSSTPWGATAAGGGPTSGGAAHAGGAAQNPTSWSRSSSQGVASALAAIEAAIALGQGDPAPLSAEKPRLQVRPLIVPDDYL